MKSGLHQFVDLKNDQRIACQTDFLRKNITLFADKKEKLPFISISREYGCFGFSIGNDLANELNKISSTDIPWAVYDKEILNKVKDDFNINKKDLEELTKRVRSENLEMFITIFGQTKSQLTIYKKLFKTIEKLAFQGNVILIGRGSSIITKNIPKGIHIRIKAPDDWKIKRIMELENCSRSNAKNILKIHSREREGYVKKIMKADLNDISYYDLIFNNSRMSKEQMISIILELMKNKRYI